jgi:hypothetical protein
MDLNKDAKLTYDEFKEGSKQDPTIVQVRPIPHSGGLILINRHYRYTTVWYRFLSKRGRVQIVEAGSKRLGKQRMWAICTHYP